MYLKKNQQCSFADYQEEYPLFTDGMKKNYTILAPNMLPWHFDILSHVLKKEGYHIEVIKNDDRSVIEEGLKHVHNDTCYPALCVIGQFLDALKSGKYDVNHTAVLITQSGGGCRASNYLPLIRKALKSEFPQVPVMSLNFSGFEKGNGIKMSASLLLKLAYGIFYGDLMMSCFNQTKPYEMKIGDTNTAREKCVNYIKHQFDTKKYKKFAKITAGIIQFFKEVPIQEKEKIKVGVVGEIYVKYSPLGNSHLEDFLLSEDCEPVVPALMDFVLYCIVNNINDARYYGKKSIVTLIYKLVYHYVYKKQKKMIYAMEKEGTFEPLHDFERLRTCADKVINQGVKMGEGWLIPAEMAVLAETGTDNIVCAQPFGCLPNHIAGKGVIRTLKNIYPDENITPIDYDPSSTKVNQENRIKLMLATARENAKKHKKA